MTTPVPVPISPAPPVPDSSLPEPIFDEQYESFQAWVAEDAAPGMQALAECAHENALDAKGSADTATAKANAANASAVEAAASVAAINTQVEDAATHAAASAASAATANTKANAANASAGAASDSAAAAAASAAAAAAAAGSAAGVSSVNARSGAVVLEKADVGLGNVNNTADTDKPISTATALALTGKAATGHTHALAGVDGLVDALAAKAPSATPTLAGLREVRAAIAAANIDLATANVFTKTIAGAITFTLSNVPAAGVSASFILKLVNGGSAAVTWFAGVKWPGGVAPVLTAAGRDNLYFQSDDGGTTWDGSFLKDVK